MTRRIQKVEMQRPGIDGQGLTAPEKAQLVNDVAEAYNGYTATRGAVDQLGYRVDSDVNALSSVDSSLQRQIADLAAIISDLPGSPAEMPTIPNLLMHLDATTIAQASQTRLATWPGLVGGRNAVRANTLVQPLYEKGVMNGRPGVTFSNARNDSMEVAGLGGTGINGSIVAVVKVNPIASGTRFIFDTNNARKYALIQQDTFGSSVLAGTVDGGMTAPATHPSLAIVIIRFAGASSFVRINGIQTDGDIVDLQVTPPATGIIGHRATLATGQGFDGAIGELMYIDRPVSADEASALERYLSGKWGVPITPQTSWYVDTVAGDDANSGRSSTSPYKTWRQVDASIRAANQSSPTIYINAPEYAPLRIPRGTGIIKDDGGTLQFLPMNPGVKWHMYGTETVTTGWTHQGSGVYSRPHSLLSVVNPIALVETLLDDHGQPTRIFKRATTETAPAAGEYGYSGGTYYIRLPGNANPNAHRIDIVSVTVLMRADNNSTITLGHGHLRGGQNAVVYALGNGGAIYAHDTTAELSFQIGAWATTANVRIMRLERCVGRYAANDGFNHHGNPGAPVLMELIDCEGAYNGDEGFSPHDDCVSIVRGGHYHHNGSGGITSVGNAVTYLNGAEVSHNRLSFSGAGSDVGGISILEQSKLVSLDLYSHDNPGPGIEIETSAGAVWTDQGGTRSGTAHGNGAPDMT